MSQKGAPSWGNYPPFKQERRSCQWRSELPGLLNQLRSSTTLAYGNGRSYGDVCLAQSGTVIGTGDFDRWRSADWDTGVIDVESGMRLGEILRHSVPRGWFLPVVPGTREVTVGGAIANDVHGKNHHRQGTFGRHVLALELLRSDRGDLACSADTHPDLFAATIGGLGLTGIITSVRLQLVKVPGAMMDTENRRFSDLGEFLQLSREFDQHSEYTAAWLDCKSPQGRGVFSAGNHTSGPVQGGDRQALTVPFTPGFSLINRATLGALNHTWYATHSDKVGRAPYRPFLFPLDGIAGWNRVYGRRGFQQYQCVIPEAESEVALREILRQIAASGTGSFLSVLKRCSDLRSPGLLSFPMAGTSLALDFPHNDTLKHLFYTLDEVVAEAGGRLYPAKDAHMSARHFQQAYPAWNQLEAQRDPALLSRFWSRVTGVEGSLP